MSTTSLADEIGKILREVTQRREEIKQEYIKAWLASAVPDKNLNIDWLIQHVHLVEKWSDDMRSVSWHLEVKT